MFICYSFGSRLSLAETSDTALAASGGYGRIDHVERVARDGHPGW